MSKRTQDNIVAVVLLIIFCWFFFTSFDYSAKARLVPVPVAAVSIILILIQLYIQNFTKNFDLQVDPTQLFKSANNETATTTQESRKATVKKQGGGSELVGMGLVILFLAMIFLFGIIPAIALFVLGYFILIGKEIWYKALAYTAICVVSIYLLFVTVLHVQVNEALLLKFFLG